MISKIVTDLMLLAGLGAVTYGAWQLLPAAGMLTGGTLLLVAALTRGRAEAIERMSEKGNQK